MKFTSLFHSSRTSRFLWINGPVGCPRRRFCAMLNAAGRTAHPSLYSSIRRICVGLLASNLSSFAEARVTNDLKALLNATRHPLVSECSPDRSCHGWSCAIARWATGLCTTLAGCWGSAKYQICHHTISCLSVATRWCGTAALAVSVRSIRSWSTLECSRHYRMCKPEWD